MNLPYVKGLDLNELNRVHRDMLDLFIKEKEGPEVERIDKVEVIDDYSCRVYTSRFIELMFTGGSRLGPHLQIMSTYRLYDNDPGPIEEGMNDPYTDYEMDRRYREVMISSVYRTLEGDEGWVHIIDPKTYEPDTSPLYIWDGRM